jgi:hypothetical protein
MEQLPSHLNFFGWLEETIKSLEGEHENSATTEHAVLLFWSK